jgi:hypothetical protein
MASINIWKCDICGKAYEENDCGYANREPVSINIVLGAYQGTDKFDFKDTCYNCRNIISKVISNIIKMSTNT